MDSNSTTPTATELFAGEAWFDPIEAGLRDRVRGFIEEMVEQELAAALGRERYARSAGGQGLPERDTRAAADRLLRPGGDQRAARPTDGGGRRDAGMAQRGAAPLRADDPAGGGADRRRLPGRDQHAGGSSARWARCSGARLARTWSAAPGAR